MSFRIGFVAVVLWLCGASVAGQATADVSPSFVVASAHSFDGKMRANLSADEQSEFRTIIFIFEGKSADALETRKCFWLLLDKAHGTPVEVQSFVRAMSLVPMADTYLAQDALVAYRTRKPYKSAQRKASQDFSMALMAAEAPNQQAAAMKAHKDDIKEEDAYVANIAARRPVFFDGANRVMTEAALNQKLS